MKIEEGYMPYLGHQTYYRVVGERMPNKAPILFLHGGPGSSHNYFELLDDLALEGHQLIMYDQIGCGKSAVPSQPELWKMDTWLNELKRLRQHLDLDEVHILGQSWGGMLLLAYLIEEKPTGIKSAILSSTLPSSALWKQEQFRMIRLMTEKEQGLLLNDRPTDEITKKAYDEAVNHYMLLHSAGPVTPASPEPLRREKVSGAESYLYAWGPNEFSPEGTLKDFDYIDRLDEIDVPVLITSGADDLSTPVINKLMFDAIPHATWELFPHSRHMPFADETEKYLMVLEQWLNQQ